MPKADSGPPLPLNGLFPIAKPSGMLWSALPLSHWAEADSQYFYSMKLIDSITPLLVESRLFYDPDKIGQGQNPNKRKKNVTHLGLKIGQGGTLDPLADGVLVIGVNRGTKHLNGFLNCSKEYESIGLLGAATTTFDADGPVLSTAPFDNITREDLEKVLDRFRGEITQVPPIFSALKMDGKQLYEYARESKPLPRPIPIRNCTVSIDLLDFQHASVNPGDGGHAYHWPTERLDPKEKEVFRRLTDIVHDAQAKEDAPETLVPDLTAPEEAEISPRTGLRPAAFKIRMTVSSGTYVRSIIHDIGLALGCGAHVVSLTRTRQGEFALRGDEEEFAGGPSAAEVPEDAGATDLGVGSGEHPGQRTSSEDMTEEEMEEAVANGGGTAAESSSGPAKSTRPYRGPSTGSIPWAVWEQALAERPARSEKEKADRARLLSEGNSRKQIDKVIRDERWRVPLADWENELLKRFVAVPVPSPGGHSHD